MAKFLRIIKIIGYILLVGVIVYLLFMKGDTKLSPEGDIISQEEVKSDPELQYISTDGSYEYEDENLILSIDVPQDMPEIVLYGEEQIDRFKSFRNEAKGDLVTESFPWNLDMKYQTYESNTIISYLVQGYEYTGGAHGNTFLKSFNYDKKTGERIDVTDIISSEDSLNVFAALADKELTIEYPEGSSGIKENWNVWYADNDSVTFIFVPYQIASYAVGQQEFTITTSGDNQRLFNGIYFNTD